MYGAYFTLYILLSKLKFGNITVHTCSSIPTMPPFESRCVLKLRTEDFPSTGSSIIRNRNHPWQYADHKPFYIL